MYLEKLKELISPPSIPIENNISPNYKNEFKIDFPNDYINLIELYGTGYFNNCLMVYNPYSSNEYANIYKMVLQTNEQYIHHKQNDAITHLSDMLEKHFSQNNKIVMPSGVIVDGIGYPFDFFPNVPGLIPWGEINGEITLFWEYDKAFNGIIVYSREGAYSKYNMTTTEFLYKLFTKKINGIISEYIIDTPCFIQQ